MRIANRKLQQKRKYKMKAALLSALVLAMSVAGFAQGPQKAEGPRQRPQMNRGFGGRSMEFIAQSEFPNEWAALEKQRAELFTKAQEKEKAFRDAVKKYRETKDAQALKTIKETLGRRYDGRLAFLRKKIADTEKRVAAAEGKGGGRMAQMVERMKNEEKRLTENGKDSWVEKQIQRMTSERKKGERKGGPRKPGQERPGKK